MSETLSNEQLENVLRMNARTLVPESLHSLFEKECNQLISLTRTRIAMKTKVVPDQELIPDEEVRFTLEGWIHEKLISFSYGRYCKELEAIGSTPFKMRPFRKKSHGSRSIYERWSAIEKMGLKPGAKVICNLEEHLNQRGEVIDINKNCNIEVRLENGNRLGPTAPEFFTAFEGEESDIPERKIYSQQTFPSDEILQALGEMMEDEWRRKREGGEH